ncbi:hypothetical protein CERZMDRAFT_93584 [Cercospora zeae-maydis SCOH1-5]|uniref:Pentacotripeptide-repeat region of PRORP domain-containing protein n=1 Tax=Cercospora zeae-maydis SCOH1-5 TaxID=717836 RepID=A0A6A6FSZ5_9PEZI|nr:hypothetical protein CERZMDRAFT_93584 [Cercospora zeae-maydis SCOH1-5]
MFIPYVCSACRLAALPKRPAALRRLSQTAFRRAEEGPVTGRYSRRELRPEQLLSQLQQPAARQQTDVKRAWRPPPSTTTTSTATTTPSRVAPPVLPATQKLYDELRRCSLASDLPATWRALQQLDQLYHHKTPHKRGVFLNIADVSRLVAVLLYKSTEQWLQSLRTPNPNPTSPTPYQIILLLHNAYVTKARYYRPVIWQIAHGLLHLSATGAKQYERGLRTGIDELMGIWRLCIGGNLARQSFDDTAPRGVKVRAVASVANATNDWTFLPPATVFSSLQDRMSDTAFEQMLSLLLPEAQPAHDAAKQNDPKRADFASAALVTLDLLRVTEQPSAGGTTLSLARVPPYKALAELLEAMLQMTAAPRVPPLLEKTLASDEEVEIRDHVKAMLARVGCNTASLPAAQENDGARSTGVPQESAHVLDHEPSNPGSGHEVLIGGADGENKRLAAAPAKSEAESFADRQIDNLVRATLDQNVARVTMVVNEVYRYAEEHKGDEPLPLKLYEHMLLTTLSMRDSKTAVEVWHHMLQLGIKPTTKTYTAMMRGAQNARDVLGMQAFFYRMRQAGLQPDEYTWSIRIFGLFKLRSVKAGMEALRDMGREWFTAAKAKAESDPEFKKQLRGNTNLVAELLRKYPGPVDGVPRPNLEIVNSAMSALAAIRPEEVPKVFSWGRSFGVEPDLATFNTLISVSMQMKRAEDALAVLRQMQERGIQADTTTWTVLLSSLFDEGFLDNLSKDAQQEKVIGYIDALVDKDNGLPGINAMGYALIIDRLIKHYDNHTAAAAVLAHMTSHGHKPTTHIYTILMTSYFDRQPQPDFAAIENLWRQVRDQGQGFMATVDVVFFDRMIEGYSRFHHLVGIGPMEEFMRRARATGKKPGWKAREAVARVYVERQMWNKLRQHVDEARLVMRDQVGRMYRAGERSFWDLIHSTGILRDEGYINREDFTKDRQIGSPLFRAEKEYAKRMRGVSA